MFRTGFVVGIVAAILCPILGMDARADGGHFTPPVYGKVAEIPGQCALIAYRDGKETLIVESSYSTEAKDVGWVIPLPSVPDRIQPVSSAAMKTLAFCLQPPVTHFMPDWFIGVSLFVFLSSLVVACGLVFGLKRAGDALAVILLCALLAGLFLPALGTAGAGTPSPSAACVNVEKQIDVGSYTVSVLRAQTPEGLNEWLKSNGFMAVPEEGRTAVSEYVRDGWCFATAVLKRSGGGVSTPHPIRFDFRTARAVYPMKLTALGGLPLQLHLYIVADRMASSELLAREFCDSYVEVREEEFPMRDNDPRTVHGRSRYFAGATFRQHIGHPELVDVAWNGCIVTKLSGRLRPRQMREDITFSWSGAQPTQRHLFSHRGAGVIATAGFVTLATFLTVVPALFLGRRLAQTDGRQWYVKRFIVPIAWGVGFAALVFFLVVPKVDVNVSRRTILPYASDYQATRCAYTTPIEDVAKTVEEWAASRTGPLRNEFTGAPIARGEASPGNYDIRRTDGRLYYIYYDRKGAEEWHVIADRTYDELEALWKDETPAGIERAMRLAQDLRTSGEVLSKLAACGTDTVRRQVACNPSAPYEALLRLASDGDYIVRRRVVMNPKTPDEVLQKLSSDKVDAVSQAAQAALAKRRNPEGAAK